MLVSTSLVLVADRVWRYAKVCRNRPATCKKYHPGIIGFLVQQAVYSQNSHNNVRNTTTDTQHHHVSHHCRTLGAQASKA